MLFLQELKKRWVDDSVFDLAAQMAYYFLLSFFPFLLLTFTLFAYLPVNTHDILNLIKPYAPMNTYHMLSENIHFVLDHPQGGLLSFSLLMTIYLSSVGFRSLIRIMDTAYRVKTERSFWKEMVLGFFLMLGILGALFVSLLFPVVGEWVKVHVFDHLGSDHTISQIWLLIRWLMTSLFLFFLFLILYIWAPNKKVSTFEALPGALFATLGWQMMSWGFSIYVAIRPFTSLYGNLGAIMVLVGWFYLSSLVLIVGGQINAVIAAKSR